MWASLESHCLVNHREVTRSWHWMLLLLFFDIYRDVAATLQNNSILIILIHVYRYILGSFYSSGLKFLVLFVLPSFPLLLCFLLLYPNLFPLVLQFPLSSLY